MRDDEGETCDLQLVNESYWNTLHPLPRSHAACP